ncbi:MAG: LamG-like jellyroll fold domain-containing protein [Cyanobacteria bacterium P01_B01_bin.77]
MVAIDSNQKAAQSQTRWLLQGRMGFRIGRRYVRIAANGIDNDFTYDETPESESQLLEIVQEWLSARRQTAFSLADTDDFVPLSFLEMGAKRSQAVCRIARYLSLADFQELLEAFRDAPNRQDYTANNLRSILGIPEQLVSEIFSPKELEQILSLETLAKKEGIFVEYDLNLMSLEDADDLSSTGNHSVVVAKTDKFYHVRIFDGTGNIILDVRDVKFSSNEILFQDIDTALDKQSIDSQTKVDLIQKIIRTLFITLLLNKIENGQINDNHLMRINPVPVGTGFLVGGSHLMTNNHVIETPEEAQSCVAQFNYVQDALGGSPTVIEYDLDPEFLFVTNPDLDYTLVQLKSGISTRPAGFQFGWLQLSGNSTNVCPKLSLASLDFLQDFSQKPTIIKTLKGKILKENEQPPGERLFLIQHPKGRRQEFNPSGCTVKDYIENGLLRNFLRYSGTSDYGASGSPVFNERWELVALHHAAILKDADSRTSEIAAYQGVRICRIVEDLQKQSELNPKLQSFIQDFVITPEQITYPPLPVALKFVGNRVITLDQSVFLATDDHDVDMGTGYTRLWSANGTLLERIDNSDHHMFEQRSQFSLDGNTVLQSLLYSAEPVKTASPVAGFQVRDFKNNIIQTITDEALPDHKKLVNTHGRIGQFDLANDGNTIVFSASYYNPFNDTDNESFSLRVWRLDQQDILLDLPDSTTTQWESECIFIKITPNSKSVAALFRNGKILFWQIDNLTPDSIIPAPIKLTDQAKINDYKSGIHRLVLSDNPAEGSQRLAIVNKDNKVRIWQSKDGWKTQPTLLQKSWDRTSPESYDVALSPDGSMLAYSDEGIKLFKQNCTGDWQPIDFHHPRYFEVHPKYLDPEASYPSPNYLVKFSPDGKTLATLEFPTGWSPYKKLRLWQLPNGSSLDESNVSWLNEWSVDPDSIPTDIHYVPTWAPTNDDFSNPLYATGENQSLTLEVWVGLHEGERDGRVGDYIIYKAPPNVELQSAVHISSLADLYLSVRGGGTIEFRGSSGSIQSSYGAIPSTKKLTHIAVTVDAEKQIWRLFVNGEETTTKEGQGGLSLAAEKNYILGKFHGLIPEVRIWNRARTPEQIRENLYRKLYDKPPGLIGYWCFDEEEKASKKVYNLVSSVSTQVQEQVWLRTGQCHGLQLPIGLRFRNWNEHLSGTIPTQANATGITVEAWVRQKFGNIDLFRLNWETSDRTSCRLAWINGRIRLTMKEKQSGGDVHTDLVMTPAAPSDQLWHHIAFTWDQASQEIVLYVDGRSQSVSILTGVAESFKTLESEERVQTIGVFPGSLTNLSGDVQIGFISEETASCDVVMAEVRLWKVRRSPREIKANLNRRITVRDLDWQNLASYWRLNDGPPSTTARNWIAPNHPLAVSKNSWFPVPTDFSELRMPWSHLPDGPTIPTQSSALLNDVHDHWARNSIFALANRDIIKHLFNPDMPITRAEVAAILVNASNFLSPSVSTSSKMNFVDVPTDFWAQPAIQQALFRGLIKAYPGNKFKPNHKISRIYTVVLLINFLRKQGQELLAPDKSMLESFPDIQAPPLEKALPDYALDALAIAVQRGMIMNPTASDEFRPLAPATRADIADMLYRALFVHSSPEYY